jgi:acyl carrier protein
MSLDRRVKEVVGECLGIKWEEIKNTTCLADDLGADSLDLADLAFRIEKEFESQKKLDITKADEDAFHTIQDILDYLHNEGIES